jgi:superfamily II DNA or RNA helicase
VKRWELIVPYSADGRNANLKLFNYIKKFMTELRPYQLAAIVQIRQAFKNNRRVLFVCPTGGGKTMIFCDIARRSTKRVLILAHRKELVEQASERIGVPHGIIMSGTTPNYDERIQIASVMT